MQLADTFDKAPKGHFYMEIRRNGELVGVIDEPNLIVDGSRVTHARLLGGDVTDRSVTQIGFGTNGAAPAAGNTALTSPFIKDVDSVSFPATDKVAFNFSLAAGENNGMAIMEFGLLTEGNVLYARRVRAVALNKESDLSFSGTWTITFP